MITHAYAICFTGQSASHILFTISFLSISGARSPLYLSNTRNWSIFFRVIRNPCKDRQRPISTCSPAPFLLIPFPPVSQTSITLLCHELFINHTHQFLPSITTHINHKRQWPSPAYGRRHQGRPLAPAGTVARSAAGLVSQREAVSRSSH